MPQLNPEFFISQLFWLFVFFSFLFIFLWRISLPRIATVLEKRQNLINDNLAVAKELQEKAQGIEKDINSEISKAKQSNNDQIKDTILTLQNEMTSKLKSLDTELEDKIARSEKEIIKNRDEEVKNINSEIINITKITVAKISDLKLSDSVVEQAVKSFKGSIN
tara:strand:+ start:283 stop:774 length:492 start_codon:yes stop_codon:yes gene_type:complete